MFVSEQQSVGQLAVLAFQIMIFNLSVVILLQHSDIHRSLLLSVLSARLSLATFAANNICSLVAPCLYHLYKLSLLCTSLHVLSGDFFQLLLLANAHFKSNHSGFICVFFSCVSVFIARFTP